jgi:hypothetical protein
MAHVVGLTHLADFVQLVTGGAKPEPIGDSDFRRIDFVGKLGCASAWRNLTIDFTATN